MKKLLLTLVSLFILSSSANAQCYAKPQYPGSGAAPKAYCWDAIAIKSNLHRNWEYVSNKYSTTYNHGGRAVLVAVDMLGYGHKPDVQMNYKSFQLVYSQNILNRYRIIVGTRYYFLATGSNLEKGTLKVKNYWQDKDWLYVR
jgi:hypothetical protein